MKKVARDLSLDHTASLTERRDAWTDVVMKNGSRAYVALAVSGSIQRDFIGLKP